MTVHFILVGMESEGRVAALTLHPPLNLHQSSRHSDRREESLDPNNNTLFN